MTVELLGHREHLHAAVDEGRNAEKPGTDHRDDQVADVVAGYGHEAEDSGEEAKQVRVLPLVRAGYHIMRDQVQLANCHLGHYQQPDDHVDNVQLADLRLQCHTKTMKEKCK